MNNESSEKRRKGAGRPQREPQSRLEEKLQKCMAENGIDTYVELASRLGWPVLEVHRLKQGKEPLVRKAIALARVLGTTVEDLFGEESEFPLPDRENDISRNFRGAERDHPQKPLP